jgi:hypothetical protein
MSQQISVTQNDSYYVKVNLMRKITTVLMLVAVGFAWVAADCSALTPDRDQDNVGVQKKRGKADGQRRGGDRDPANRVQKIIEQFDADADQKLDASELQEFLASVAQRRGQGQGQRGGRKGGKGEAEMNGEKRGKRGGRKGKNKPGSDTDFQGATPNLPPSE